VNENAFDESERSENAYENESLSVTDQYYSWEECVRLLNIYISMIYKSYDVKFVKQ